MTAAERFQAQRTSVVVTLLSGRNVPIENYNRTDGDAYIIIALDAGDDEKDETSDHRFTTKTNTPDPVWNERAWLTCVGTCTSLTARVYDANGPLLWDTSLGTASICLQDGEHTISLFGGTYSFTMTLLKNRRRYGSFRRVTLLKNCRYQTTMRHVCSTLASLA